MSGKTPNHPQQPSAPPPSGFGWNQSQYHPPNPPPSYDTAMNSQYMPAGPPFAPTQYPQNPNAFGFVPAMSPQQPQYYYPGAPGTAGPSMPPSQQPPYPGHIPPTTGYAQNVAPATAVFDSGARFNNGQMTVPPPPPGYMPTQAQVAAMNGQSVHVQKAKNSFWTGGKGAGTTFW